MVVSSGRVPGHVAGCVFPGEAGPIGSGAPVFAGIAGVGVAVVDSTWQLADTAGVVTRCLTQWSGAWTGVLVEASTVALAGRTGEGVAKAVNGFVYGHVGHFEHGFDALEVAAVCEVAAVNNGTNVGPFGVH